MGRYKLFFGNCLEGFEKIPDSSNENQIVLDPFMGSGVCGEVYLRTNRKFLGMEKDEKYFNLSKERIIKFDNI